MKFLELYNLLTEQKNKKVSLMIGRFSPFHKSHNKIIKSAKYPVVILIVKGEQTSKDKSKNPFSYELQKHIIEVANNKKIIDIEKVPNANLKVIIPILKEKGFDVKEILCGEDREKDYSNQVERYFKDDGISCTIIERDGVSATMIRKLLLNKDYEKISELMINIDKKLFNKMIRAIQDEV
jgi:nicotinamide mononucleotide adenylyltransferase